VGRGGEQGGVGKENGPVVMVPVMGGVSGARGGVTRNKINITKGVDLGKSGLTPILCRPPRNSIPEELAGAKEARGLGESEGREK